MNRLTTLLTLLLVIQLLLAAALFWPRDNPGESDARSPLLALDPDTVDRVVISSTDDSLLLRRENGRWVMPDYHNLPAQESRVDRALDALPSLSRGWAVAGTESAAERFEVSPGIFQRKIEYFSGEQADGAIYIGTSPGFRKVHVSPADDGRVYAVEFNAFELPVTGGEWLDKSLLQLEQVRAVNGLDYAIRRRDDSWIGDNGKIPATGEVDSLINGLSGLRVTGVADIATAGMLADVPAPPTLSVESGDGSYEFRLYEIEENYYIKRSDIPVFFSLGAFDHDRLNDVTAQTLYPAEEDTDDSSEASPNASETD
jgi:hypothetical protein